MKIINPSVKLLAKTPDAELLLERAGRTCYKSERSITPESAGEFIKRVIANGHLSVLEHASASMLFICDRGVTHEMVRHRIASFSQECVSGDTVIRQRGSRKLTIRDLYERLEGSKYDRTHNKTLNLRSVDTGSKKVIPNKIKNVFYKGVQPTVEITTHLGYKIKCTKEHKFLTSKGFKKLSDLRLGDSVYVNGRPALCYLTDKDLRFYYIKNKLSPKEIALETGANVRHVYARLHESGLFSSHRNDKNKKKYNKNHTKKSVEKMRRIVLEQYKNGRKVWNKGIVGKDSHVFGLKRSDIFKGKCSTNKLGKKNPAWKGGTSQGYCYNQKAQVSECEICGESSHLEVHHIDKNRKNNSARNLMKLCRGCHQLIHKGWHVGQKIVKDKIVSIVPVGLEDVYDLEMVSPYNNYVANGFVVHNSTRYCNYSKSAYGGQIGVIRPNNLNEKQLQIWERSVEEAEKSYMELLNNGVAPQIARSVLPNCLKTEIVMTCNFREWRHVFSLRSLGAAGKPHPQIKEVMDMALLILKQECPNVFGDL